MYEKQIHRYEMLAIEMQERNLTWKRSLGFILIGLSLACFTITLYLLTSIIALKWIAIATILISAIPFFTLCVIDVRLAHLYKKMKG